MNKKNLQKIYFVFFKIFIFLALLLSIINSLWINVLLTISILILLYLPELLGKPSKEKFPSKVEILVLSLLYFFIFIETSGIINLYLFWIRVFFYLILSSIIALIGFYIIYILNKQKKDNLNLNSLTLATFAFCFSVTLGTLWQISRFFLNYVFNINIQNYNASDSLGFLLVHFLGAFIVSFVGYLYLEPKLEILQNTKKHITFFIGDKIGLIQIKKLNKQKELQNLIKCGESKTLEFKSTLRTNLFTNEHDKNIEHSTFKTINAFLNTHDGTLLVGVEDNGFILGLQKDNFKSDDKLYLHFSNLIKKHLGGDCATLISYEIIDINNKKVLKIDVKKSKKPVFITSFNQEEFYIRSGPSSIPLSGSKLVDYIKESFN